MKGFLAEVIRIAAAPVAGLTGPAAPFVAPGLLALANQLDKEDEPGTPDALRKMKQKRREDWIKFAVNLEKDKKKRLEKHPEVAREAIGRVLGEAAGADLRAVIRGDIFETEGREATDQEVNLLAEAVSARVREKL
jgi:hypothetical protein